MYDTIKQATCFWLLSHHQTFIKHLKKKHRTYFSVMYLFNVLDKGQMMASSAETCCLFSRFVFIFFYYVCVADF